MIKIKGKVNKVEKKNFSHSYIAQGYKKGETEPLGATAGSNGTFRIGYPEVSYHVIVTVEIFNSQLCKHHNIDIDIRNALIESNDWIKMTKNRVNLICDRLLGEFVDIENCKGEWRFVDELNLANISEQLRQPNYMEIFAPPHTFNSMSDYLKFRFKTNREYRDFLISKCRNNNFREYDTISKLFPYTDEYLDKPLGTEITDSDYSNDVEIVGTGNKRKIVYKS